MTRRLHVPLWLGLILFVVMPLVELFVLIQVGQVIGAWWTIALLLADSVFGAWLLKREGARAWQALQGALRTGKMPSTELADGALILVGGTLMMAPGFVTDAFGILLILPFTRPFARRILASFIARRFLVVPVSARTAGPQAGGTADSAENATRPGPGSQGTVVQGEVVD